MATEKRLYDVLKHRLECHIARAISYGVKDIPMGKDSSSAVEFLRGYERGAIETANIALDLVFRDAVEVVHGRWEKHEPDKHGNRKPKCSVCGEYNLAWWSDYTWCNYCPNCGAKMDGGSDETD